MYRISYKSARKENHLRKVCPYDIRKHNVFKIISSLDNLQNSQVQDIKKAEPNKAPAR